MPFPMHPKSRALRVLLATLLLSAALAGCLGADDDAAKEDPGVQRAQVTQDTGGVEGVVIDNAVSPIAGANVTAAETGDTAMTSEDGSFALSNLPPGQVTLVASAPGYHSVQKQVAVTAGEVATVEFTLTRVAVQQPYIDKLEFAGYQECATKPGFNTSETGEWYLGISTCSIPNFAFGGNVTNDRFMFIFATAPDMEGFVFEAEWQPSQPNAGAISWNVEAQGYPDTRGMTFTDFAVESPAYAVIPRETVEAVDANLTARCEDGDDNACGRSYVNNGDEVQIRAFPDWRCVSDTAGICNHVQQPFNVYVSVFYHQEIPSGYSVLGGV